MGLQLEAFEALYAQGTYRKAAASLGLTSTLVKARIQALESTLGGPLLYRKSGRLRFTELGYNFIGVAFKVLQEEKSCTWLHFHKGIPPQAVLEAVHHWESTQPPWRFVGSGASRCVDSEWLATKKKPLVEQH
ncbi:helix-turn-helix domain-containing protein [Deinococcus misasensis]|uniref:helix-turn-helix domain-containing protein n=1 Tax=Deinococcus misasensis TaxID=392413 RepID=UPI000551E4F3|nr:LysR family transcriptional regulator [Deinococcus misasensis]